MDPVFQNSLSFDTPKCHLTLWWWLTWGGQGIVYIPIGSLWLHGTWLPTLGTWEVCDRRAYLMSVVCASESLTAVGWSEGQQYWHHLRANGWKRRISVLIPDTLSQSLNSNQVSRCALMYERCWYKPWPGMISWVDGTISWASAAVGNSFLWCVLRCVARSMLACWFF